MDAKMKLLIVGFSVSPYTLPTEKYRPQVTRQLKNWLFTFLGQQKHIIYNLLSLVKASYTLLRDALKERFSPAHPHLRNRQELSKRRQGPSESTETYLADLNEKFNCLDLRFGDKICYLIQGLHADIQAEVLKKEPKTYNEAEKTARLIYSIEQSTLQRKEEDVSRIVQAASCMPSKLMLAQLLKYKVLLLEYSINLTT